MPQAAQLIKSQLIKSRLIKQGLIFAGSIAAICTVAVSPAQALSLAEARGSLRLTNFQPGFSDTLSSTGANSFSFSDELSSATALTDALANISQSPTSQVSQESSALAVGEGTNYFGEAESSSVSQGFFNPGSRLTFRFTAVLDLLSVSDRATPGEFSLANGSVGFGIFDGSNNLLDAFSLTGLVSSEGANSLNISNSSPFLSFSTPIFLQGGDDFTNFGLAVVRGSYSRTFDSAIPFSIRGETQNEAIVAVPSPALVPGALMTIGAIVSRRKRKAQLEEVTK